MMKIIVITICFIIWCIITLTLAISLAGLVILKRDDYYCKEYQGEEGKSSWLKIGDKLVNKLIQ